MDLEVRIARLEKQNRHWKRLSVLVVFILSLIVMTGADAATPNRSKNDYYEVPEKGPVRARLDENGLRFYNGDKLLASYPAVLEDVEKVEIKDKADTFGVGTHATYGVFISLGRNLPFAGNGTTLCNDQYGSMLGCSHGTKSKEDTLRIMNSDNKAIMAKFTHDDLEIGDPPQGIISVKALAGRLSTVEKKLGIENPPKNK